jgi:hypothetical protein
VRRAAAIAAPAKEIDAGAAGRAKVIRDPREASGSGDGDAAGSGSGSGSGTGSHSGSGSTKTDLAEHEAKVVEHVARARAMVAWKMELLSRNLCEATEQGEVQACAETIRTLAEALKATQK